MKKILSAGFITVFFSMLMTAPLFSFAPAGGEGFEIWLNDKLVMQRFGKEVNTVKELKLEQQHINGTLRIVYHHCGKPGTDRVLQLKNTKNEVIKQWKFGNAKQTGNGISCRVNEIMQVRVKNTDRLRLVYISSELPQGRDLAILSVSATALAKL